MRTLLALALLPFAGWLSALDIGDQAPSLAGVTWVKGEAAESKGSIAIVEFWATWCGPCKRSIPHLSELAAKNAGKLLVVGLSDEDEATVKPFVAEMGEQMAYRVGLVAKDGYQAWMEGRDGIPHAFLLDAQGQVLWTGHPMELDQVLPKVMDGSFDLAKAKLLAGAEQDLDASLQGEQPDLPKAKQAIAALLAIAPLHQKAINIGIAIAKHEEDAPALRAVMAAIPLDRIGADQANSLAWERVIEQDLAYRNLDLALALVDRALTLEPANGTIIDTRARILYQLGLLDQAIAEQERAVKASPEQTSLQDGLKSYREIAAQRDALLGKPATPAAPTVPVLP